MAEKLSTAKKRPLTQSAITARPLKSRFHREHRISVEFKPLNLPTSRQKKARAGSPPGKHSGSNGKLNFHWSDAISNSEWATYKRAIDAVRQANIPFLLGGGFALATFTGRWRDTKDIDLYVMPQARKAAIAALTRAGFSDYFKVRPYDRRWIYRSVRSGVIVDIIWSMANRRARVDKTWFAHAQSVTVREEKLLVVPMEEFLWCKLYILQRDHCDWTDIFNLLYSSGTKMAWKHLVRRLQNDTSLLKAVLLVYSWICPGRAALLPLELWRLLGMTRPKKNAKEVEKKRVRFLDSRAWFAALQRSNKKLQV